MMAFSCIIPLYFTQKELGSMAERSTAKRQRNVRPEVEDVLRKGRMIMHDDPFKDRAPKEEDRLFVRALFG